MDCSIQSDPRSTSFVEKLAVIELIYWKGAEFVLRHEEWKMRNLTSPLSKVRLRQEYSTTIQRIAWKSKSNALKVNNYAIPSVANEYLAKILTSQVYEAAIESPLEYAHALSKETGNKMYLKREDLQPVFSFKIRGAYNKIAKLPREKLEKGIVACSAGNHAQGVAYSAKVMDIDATIIMPLATPNIKVSAVRRHGGDNVKIKLHGQNYDEAAAEANRLVKSEGKTLVHPFDDPEVIAGQGTIGIEIVKKMNGKDLDAVFICVGGGGLLAGVASALKALRPDVKVIGVEADDAAGMTAALTMGKVVTLPSVGLFADGAAVRTVGEETYSVCKQLVDEMITVSTDEICAAIKHGFNDTRCILEPAGALAIAGMMKYSKSMETKEETYVAISSGANMDFDRLRFVSERADSSEYLMAVGIPERPGSFKELYDLVRPRNVTEFSYRGNSSDQANVFMSVQSQRGVPIEEDKPELLRTLDSRGYSITDFSANEMAKAHARHLAGGRPTAKNGGTGAESMNELVYRFEFPEAPGALEKFLDVLHEHNQGWSISLFHYRNHGHDFGRVLVGLLVPDEELAAFDTFLANLAYKSHKESDNEAYKIFLK